MNAPIEYAKTCLKRIIVQLEQDLGVSESLPVNLAILAAIQECDKMLEWNHAGSVGARLRAGEAVQLERRGGPQASA